LFLAAVGFVVASIAMPTLAWANYRTSGVETNTFGTHVLGTPGQPSCGLISLFNVTISWTAPADSAYVTTYEIGMSTSKGGTYPTYATTVTGTTAIVAAPTLGTRYFVVRSANHSWRGPDSTERAITSVLGVALC
jgi:hypothetical protein